jgi:acyl transferase domain-containing protein
MEWGIMPKAMIGHSIGEYVAACLAGVMTLEDALSVVSMRGRLMDSMPGGSMLAVPLPEAALQPVLQFNISLAAVNAPAMSVLSGPGEAIDALEKQFVAQGLPCRKLHTSHAFHSSMMEPVLMQFVERMKRIKLKSPQIPCLSNLTGAWMTPELATNPEYWGYHMRQTVRFSDNLIEVMAFPDLVLLEVGPGQTLGLLARQQGSRSSSQLIVSSLPGPQEKDHVSDVDFMAQTVAQLWLGGVKLDWCGFHRREQPRRLPLPTYPFERQRYWLGPLEEITLREAHRTAQIDQPAQPQPVQTAVIESAVSAGASVATASPVPITPARGSQKDIARWIYVPLWKPAVNPAKPSLPDTADGSWLIFGERSGLSMEIEAQLKAAGAKLNLVVRGSGFARQNFCYEIRPGERTDYDALVQDLKRRKEYPNRVLHLWSAEDEVRNGSAIDDFDATQIRSFYSVIFLSQALAKANATALVHIGVVTDCLQSVFGDERLRANEATVLGACKVISQEYPNLRCRNIDIVLADVGNADALIQEMNKEPFQAVVAYRKGRRWLEQYDSIQLEKPSDKLPLLSEGGVYLMTGGLGNIALLLAEAIAAEVNARFILTGRSAFPARGDWEKYLKQNPTDPTSAKIRKLINLEQNGCELMVMQADAADPDQMQAVVGQAIAKWGAIDGVIHGAANLAPDAFGPLMVADRAAGDNHFRPKAHGLLVIEELLRDQPLRFCFLLSSLSAVLGGLGLACYAGSNAYLDAAARHRNQQGTTSWITVNWDSWTFSSPQSEGDGIGPAEGQDCFRRIMASGLKHVVVSTTPLADRLARWVELRTIDQHVSPTPATPANGASGSVAGTVELHGRPSLSTQFVAPRNETEKSIAGVWEHLLGVTPIGIHDKFFELGGHSLLAIQLLARLREIFDLDMPVQRIFEAPTVAQLAESIEQQIKTTASAAKTDDTSLNDILKLVESLSEDELDDLLKEADAS